LLLEPQDWREWFDDSEVEATVRAVQSRVDWALASLSLDRQKDLLRQVIGELQATLDRLEQRGIDG